MLNNKKVLFLLLLLLVFISFNYAVFQSIEFENRETRTVVTSSDLYGLSLFYQFDRLNHFTVSTEQGEFTEILIDSMGQTNDIGEPKLPISRRFIAVPLGAEVAIRALNYEVAEFVLADFGISYPIMPAQHSVPKCPDIEPPPFEFNEQAYNRISYTGQPLVKAEEVGIMRGVRLFAVELYPIDYNPQAGTIRVYNDVEVEVTFIGGDFAATEELRQRTHSPYFEFLYEEQIMNYETVAERQNLTRYPVKYIIITHSMFVDALDPFIDWKTMKGFETIVGVIGSPEVGSTTTSIKNYIQGIWNAASPQDPAPSFVLFVGDTAQIPAYSGGDTVGNHISDLHYVRLEGTDYLPEMFYGRFSANNLTELQPQIDKTLFYEKLQTTDPSYLGEVVLIAGVDASWAPSHANGHINYGTEHYFNASNGIYSHTYLYPASGSSSAAIINDVSNGVGYVNYTAHGSSTSWSDPSFTISNVYNLQNDGKYTFAVGNCCVTNKFEVTECFGEAWLRAPNKGAIGYIGGTNNTYWNEDYWWGVGYIGSVPSHGNAVPYNSAQLGMFDRLFHTHGESFTNWFTTGGAMIYAGNLAVEQSTSSLKNYYWEIYALMGDPSLTPYMREPLENIANYPQQIFLGQSEIQITAEPYSYVGLSMDGELYGAGLVDAAGQLTLEFTPFTSLGEATLVITLQNHAPIISELQILPLAGPFVVLNDYEIVGNMEYTPQYGETVNFHVTLENLGIETATNVSAQLSTEDTYITIVDDYQFFGNINAGSTTTVNNAYQILIADSITNQHRVFFTLQITDNDNEWSSNFNFYVNSPVLEVSNLMIQDPPPGGNNNGRLDPGETVSMVFTVENIGQAASQAGTATLEVNNPLVDISTPVYNITAISPGANIQTIYTVTVDESINPGTVVEFTKTMDYGAYTTVYYRYIPVGLVLEDFETGDFSSFPWEFAGNADWTIVTDNVYEGLYSAKSGTIAHNQNTAMEVTLNVAANSEISFYRKVSSEANYDFLYFFIDGVQQAQWSGEVDWSQVSYPVNAGERTFRWTYMKDGSVSSGSDCAWVDYIVFPALIPQDSPRNLIAHAGNGYVDLSWSTPVDGVPSSYNIYKNGSLVNNTGNLTYTDNSVINGVTYTYYVTAVYPTYESGPSNTVQAIPNTIQIVDIGTGTSVNGTSSAAPINIWYRSLRGQMVYTAAEINSAGFQGPGLITHLGFYVTQTPLYSLPNFLIRMKHTTATNASAHDPGPYQAVYTTASYTPNAGGWDMLELSEPFEWNGVDNILVDTAFSLVPNYNASGQQRIFNSSNGFRYVWNDNSDQTNSTTTTTANYKPQIRMQFVDESEPPYLDVPEIIDVYVENGNIYISWVEVIGATDYLVESSDSIEDEFLPHTPEGIFSVEGNIVTWESPITDPMRFYRVKALITPPVSRYPDLNKTIRGSRE
ncbi:MAG: Gingipain R [Candidatus Cloacimonetes bacterium]|nr:Gingipain R [Candidatus Cloacimonadota bacterium]